MYEHGEQIIVLALDWKYGLLHSQVWRAVRVLKVTAVLQLVQFVLLGPRQE